MIRFKPHKKGTTLLPQLFQIEEVTVGPKDITGATIKLQFKTSPEGPVEFEMNNDPGGGLTVTNAVNGEFQTDQRILDIPAFDYICAIEITYADGIRDEPMKWIWPIYQDIVT